MNARIRTCCVMLAIAVGFGFTGCAANLTHPPVYRGQYYAFDVYPYGYKGYPAFPYYGAPFGIGGPAFAVTEQRVVQSNGKEVQTTYTVSRSHRHHQHAADR